MTKARITKAMRDTGIEFVRVKSFDPDRSLIGIHLLEPTQCELEDAVQVAERDMFPAIYIHRLNTWGHGMHGPRYNQLKRSTA